MGSPPSSGPSTRRSTSPTSRPRPGRRRRRRAARFRRLRRPPFREGSRVSALAARARSRPNLRATTFRRPVVLAGVGIAGLVVALVAGVAAGSVYVPPGDTLAILAHRILGLDLGVPWTQAQETIVVD